jgi:3-methyladenine DNA glycosylase Mpg
VETEACTPEDPTGCARPGLTTSNAPLSGARGTASVRMVYGAFLTTRIGLSRDQQRRLRVVERGSPFVSVPP